METRWLLLPRERRLLVFLALLCSGLAISDRLSGIGTLIGVAGLIYGIVVGVSALVRWGRPNAPTDDPYDTKRAGYLGLGLIAISLLIRDMAPAASAVLFWTALILNIGYGVAHFVRGRK